MMEITWLSVTILIGSGIIAGFINTLAGGGTVVSFSTFMFLGLPPMMANGTIRLSVIFQNITSVAYFQKSKLIDWRRVLQLGVPVVLGSIVGAVIAGFISNEWFRYIFAGVIVLFGFSMLFNPDKYLHEKTDLVNRKLSVLQYIIYFFVGIYGGFIHAGIGYVFLAVLVLSNGYNIFNANVMKNVLVLLYVPFSVVVFALQGNVLWSFGLIHAIGNIIGAGLAAHLAIKKGAGFIRYIVLALIIVVVLQLFRVF